jgi:hypothetical protein
MRHQILGRFEQLEPRRYLAVAAQVIDGDLIVDGDADGMVQITAVAEAEFHITDDGVDIATLEGVTDDIRIELDQQDAAASDHVTLDLGGQAVDRVVVDLGDGDNAFVLQNGTVGGSLKYEVGAGDDTLEIAADAVIEKSVYAHLGDGDNHVVLAGLVERNLSVKAGVGDDDVEITEESRVERDVKAYLGDGDNQLTHEGEVGRSLYVRGGVDDDTVDILADALVERSVSLSLGDGDNALVLGNGDDSTDESTDDSTDDSLDSPIVEGDLRFRSGDGDDSVEITEDATVGGDVCIQLGDGENSVTHSGDIDGDLRVSSANEDDEERVVVDEGNVGGETELRLGEDFGHDRPGRHHFGHGGFGGGFFGFRPFGGRGFMR